MKNQLFLTVDLEDYRRICCQQLGLPPRSGSYYVEKGVEKILQILERTQTTNQITFFTTAQVARDQSDLVRKIAKAGHEIACHSYDHENIAELTPDRFQQLLRRATSILEDVGGQRVLGFRAPSFRLPENPQSFYEVLAREGYLYSSSACLSSRRFVDTPYNSVLVPKGRILEFPTYMAYPWSPVPIRTVGGTYFRLLPLTQIEHLLQRAISSGYAGMVWLHPSDVISDFQPVSWSDARRTTLGRAVKWPLNQLLLEKGTRSAPNKLEVLLKSWALRGRMIDSALAALPATGEYYPAKQQVAA